MREWGGSLHSHSRNEPKDLTPEKISAERTGSNCGSLTVESIIAYQGGELKNRFIAITDHSRDGAPEFAIKGNTEWFIKLLKADPVWLKTNLGIDDTDQITDEQEETIRKLAEEEAKKVALYGDERIIRTLKRIDQAKKPENITVLKGIEANLLPDGTFDTDVSDRGKFEIINCSIHPPINYKKFEPIISDPAKLTDLIITGIRKPETNIFCHIGYCCKKEVIEQLDWKLIGEEALKHKVALEINLGVALREALKEVMDLKKYPNSQTAHYDVFLQKIKELAFPTLTPKILAQLKPMVEKGLVFAINPDEHQRLHKPWGQGEEDPQKAKKMNMQNFRFWRCMLKLEQYFNEIFEQLGADQNNILNTYSTEKLKEFLAKK